LRDVAHVEPADLDVKTCVLADGRNAFDLADGLYDSGKHGRDFNRSRGQPC
jgi:hypothetical protein